MIEVYKFGGASVKDAEGVKNLVRVLENNKDKNKLIVVSAMGKTTNALEVVVNDYLNGLQSPESLSEVKLFHRNILDGLFHHDQEPVYFKVDQLFTELENFLQHNKSNKYDFVYDQIVSFGELISTTIVSDYLNTRNITNNWLDARDFIKTDSTYRDAQVNWTRTQEKILDLLDPGKLNITQGFIGSDSNNFTTTLGREGSDYSAAIFAYCLNAESVTIWKDVPGVLNADPRYFEKAQLLNKISYEEAIELAFYGASVIHPKTLQPLQRKEIPLFVRSFMDPIPMGTAVSKGDGIDPAIPCFIVKKNQVLISLSSLDFSFMVEENISEIFRLFHQYQMKVDLIQNSAISFRVCVDNKFNQLEKLVQHLKARFKVNYKTGVSLYTIRHFSEQAITELEKDKVVLLKQLTQNTVQMVTEN
ncbi:Aspartokinase [Christiangramia flava JLT2011]|uniref:Aspartokinase n=1 Tax=Christiangramia flava JLT2011 TaxID=1229726 RepID=A0A1L7I5G0_9FLAO|nr:Aspartokinase [Christiangramia flava JLT2011]OSS40809.1 Aspartokinase [Christiangramia flava JLT2011]